MSCEAFTIEDGLLVRAVFPDRGRPYIHRCPVDTFQDVCHAIDEAWAPFSGEDLVAITGEPHTAVFTALAFLKEVGSIVPAQRRKHKSATADVYCDGMIEWNALAEGSVNIVAPQFRTEETPPC